MKATKDGLEPLRLKTTARCASRGDHDSKRACEAYPGLYEALSGRFAAELRPKVGSFPRNLL